MSDFEEDLEVPETEEPLGWFGPGKGKPVTIKTNEDVWIVLGPTKSFKVQRLKVESQPITIMPDQGKVGIVTDTTGDQPGQREFTVKMFKVQAGNELEVRAEEVEVIKMRGKEKRIEFSLYRDQKDEPERAVQETYAEVRCVTRADVLKMVVGTTAKVLGAGATVAGEISLVKSYHVFNSPSVGGVLGALPEGVDNAAGQ